MRGAMLAMAALAGLLLGAGCATTRDEDRPLSMDEACARGEKAACPQPGEAGATLATDAATAGVPTTATVPAPPVATPPVAAQPSPPQPSPAPAKATTATTADDHKRACDAGKLLACYRAGEIYYTGKGQPRDYGRAAPIYRRLCDRNDYQACTAVAWMYYSGFGQPRNLSRAMTLYDLACRRGRARACADLGTMYENGDGITRDAVRAQALFRQACKGGSKSACGKAAARDRAGSRTRANNLYAEACEVRTVRGCADWPGKSVLDRVDLALEALERDRLPPPPPAPVAPASVSAAGRGKAGGR